MSDLVGQRRKGVILAECDRGAFVGDTQANLVIHHTVKLVSRADLAAAADAKGKRA